MDAMLLWKRILALGVIWVWCIAGTALRAQEVIGQRFVITSCPGCTSEEKQTYNQRAEELTSEAEFLGLLRSEFGRMNAGMVRYQVLDPNGSLLAAYVYNIPERNSQRLALATLASKGLDTWGIRSRSELRDLFADTLVIRDTLRLWVRLSDAGLAPSGYLILWRGTNDEPPHSAQVPNMGDSLLFSALLIGGKAPCEAQIVLRHRTSPEVDLAKGVLRFLAPEEWRALDDLRCALRSNEQGLDSTDLDKLQVQLIRKWYGKVHPPNVVVHSCP
ncbi:MAG: hypothetical protein H6595_14605 [Flavobacteriales bacterium]|nr:hypothetical protein [Flavobacteriales bacterium]